MNEQQKRKAVHLRNLNWSLKWIANGGESTSAMGAAPLLHRTALFIAEGHGHKSLFLAIREDGSHKFYNNL